MIRVWLVLVLLVLASAAQAATRYVDIAAGNDTNTCAQSVNPPGGSYAPKQHLTGASGALNCMVGGDTLIVRGGNYDEYIYSANTNRDIPSGTAGAHTIIQAYPGETPTLKPTTTVTEPGFAEVVVLGVGSSVVNQYIDFDGINIDGRVAGQEGNNPIGVVCDPPFGTGNYITFKNGEFWAGQGHDSPGGPIGIGLYRSQVAPCPGGHRIQNNTIHGGGIGFTPTSGTACGSPCQAAYNIYVVTADTVIENNIMDDARWIGVQAYCSGGCSPITGIIIRNNLIRNITRGPLPGDAGQTIGIIVGGAMSGVQVYNNIIHNVDSNCASDCTVGIYISGGSTGTLVYNNTVYDVNGHGIWVASSETGTVIRNNISYLSTVQNYRNDAGGETTAIKNLTDGTNPNFVSGSDFHLSATSTASIDTGDCLGTVTTDKDGVARPQGPGCDRGAYEYLVTGTLPGVPTSLSPVSGATGVDLFASLSFASANATAFDFSISPYVGVSTASFQEFFDGVNTTDLGASWVPYGIGFTNAQRFNNRARNTSTTVESVEKVTGTTFAPNQWCRMRLITFGTGQVSAACFFRLNADAQPSGLFIGASKGYASGYRSWAYRYTNGAFVFLGGEMATPWAANDFLEAHVVGQTLTIYRNGNDALALTLTATDPTATYTAGTVGLYLFSSTLGQLEVDNFEAGDIGPVFQGTFSTATYSLSNAIPNTTYYWIPAGRNGQGVTEGSIATFTTTGGGGPSGEPVGIRVRFKAP